MSLQDLGSLGELIGAIATIATLIYLAVQIRANTRTTQASAIQFMLEGARERISMQGYVSPDLGEITAIGLSAYEELTDKQRIRFFWYLTEHVLQLQNVMNLRRQGMLAELDYRTWVNYVCSFVNTPGGKIAWEQCARAVSPDVRDVIENHLANNPDHPSLLELTPLFDSRRWEKTQPAEASETGS